MTKLVVVTNYLPKYSVEFYNRLIELHPSLALTVVADISTNIALNQYKDLDCKFNVIDCPIAELKGILIRRNLNNIIRSEKPDKLVFYGNPREISITVLMLFYKITGRQFSVYGMFHRIGGQTLGSKIYYKIVGGLSEKILTYSKKGADVLLSLGVKSSKINIVGTAINEKVNFHIQAKLTDNKLKKFKEDNNLLNKKIVLQVVRLSKIKKPLFLIEAAKAILQKRKDIVFILIGEGELFETIKQEVYSSGFEQNIRLLGSIYDEDTLAYWFKSSHVFVMPTCIGLSAHHAFSYGLPIITDNDLLNQASEFDILYDGLNSKLYEAGSIDSMSNAIMELVDDDEYRNFLSLNAISTVKIIHTLDSKCMNFLHALDIRV